MTNKYILQNNQALNYGEISVVQLNDIFGKNNWQQLPNPPAHMEYPEWNNKTKQWENNDPRTYAEKRQSAYPEISEQLDMLYHDKINGTDNWQKTISAVKQKYPKV